RLIAGAAFVALATLTRYVGVALVPAGVVAALLAGGSAARRVVRAAAFAVVAVTPIALWLARNVALTGTPAGERVAPSGSLLHHAWLVIDHVTRWWLPTRVPAAARVAVAGLVLALLVTRLSVAQRRHL